MRVAPAPEAAIEERPGGQPQLARTLSVTDASGVIVGSIIGSGIFLVTTDIVRLVGSPLLVVAVWIAAGVLTLFGALTYAELGAARPQAGGQYVYLRDAYGPVWGFLYGWVLFWVIQTGSIAAVGMAFGRYLGAFVEISAVGVQVAAIACILFLTAVNAVSVRCGAVVQNAFTVMKCGVVAALVVLGMLQGDHLPAVLSSAGGTATVSAFGAAMIAALWAYDGWNQASFIAGEVKDPERSLPLSLFLGTGLVVLIYVAVNGAYLAVLTPAQIAGSQQVASDAATELLGGTGARLISAGILVSTFGCLNGMILSGPRVYFAMARDRLFFPMLDRVHASTGTPMAAILAQGVWSAALVLSGSYEALYTYVMFAAWVFYAMTGAAVFIFRRRDAQRPHATWGYPWVPALFVLVSLFLVVNTLWTNPKESGYGLLFIALGLPAYHLFRRSHHRPHPRQRPGRNV